MTTIWVTFQQEGWHRWPEAPLYSAYLANPHRHMFHFRVEIAVEHADRNIEFHKLKEFATQHLWMTYERAGGLYGIDFQHLSCEMLAEEMAHFMLDHWSAKWAACEVSEDGECGARVEVGP